VINTFAVNQNGFKNYDSLWLPAMLINKIFYVGTGYF